MFRVDFFFFLIALLILKISSQASAALNRAPTQVQPQHSVMYRVNNAASPQTEAGKNLQFPQRLGNEPAVRLPKSMNKIEISS